MAMQYIIHLGGKMLEELKCGLLHFKHHQIVRDAGSHFYYTCNKCNRRWIEELIQGYFPVDKQWVRTGKFMDISPATDIGSVIKASCNSCFKCSCDKE